MSHKYRGEQGLAMHGGYRVWEPADVEVLEHQDSPFSSPKALEIETLLGNLGLALCDNMINVSVRMTRIVVEED